MTGPSALPRGIIIFILVVPLTVLLGILLAAPDQLMSFALLALLIGVLTIPIFLRWHHAILIFGWYASVNVFILPGQPPLWMLLSVMSFFLSLVNLTMDRERAFIKVPAINWPLFFLTAVVFITAQLTSGMALRSLGGTTGAIGGKYYFYILFAIAGYFGMTSQRIPRRHASLFVTIFFLSGLSAICSNLAYGLGPSFYFLFYLFPVDTVSHQVTADYMVGQEVIVRLSGFFFAGLSAFAYMLMRYGIKGILDFSKPLRFLSFCLIIFASMLGGFRSIVIIFALALIIQFFLEGLHRTHLMSVAILSGIALSVIVVLFANRMPMSIQRSLSFLPLEVDATAKWDAQNSLRWRLEMWQILKPQVPKYLFLGKGYASNPTDLYMSVHSRRRGFIQSNEAAMIAGNYHNGPLSVLIPFGIWGMIGFVWLLAAGIRVLWKNYRYGDPAYKNINTLLLSLFLTRIVFFFTFFGAFAIDFYHFVGILGLSISLNGGVSKASTRTSSQASAPTSSSPVPA